MNAEFNWWLLIVGLVIGAGLVWLILADSSRREADVTERERRSEVRWIAAALQDQGRRVSDDDVSDVLDLHRAYLEAPPPDELLDEPVDEPESFAPSEPSPADRPGTTLGTRPPPRAAMAHPAPTTAGTGTARSSDSGRFGTASAGPAEDLLAGRVGRAEIDE